MVEEIEMTGPAPKVSELMEHNELNTKHSLNTYKFPGTCKLWLDEMNSNYKFIKHNKNVSITW